MAYGSISKVDIGRIFQNRRALYDAGVHRDIERGIIGRKRELGAESIVLSSGYEDDIDKGDLILYTGEGGRDSTTKRQIQDQEMNGRNSTLALNVKTRQTVRVIRKVAEGFRYDGLYSVESAERVRGVSGFLICRFQLKRAP